MAQATFMEWTLQHELGHHVHDFHAPGVLEKYRDAMEVKPLTDAEAEKQIGAANLAEVKKRGGKGTPVMVGDKGYVLDGGKVRSYQPDLFPGGYPSSEYFSEHYNQAILQPESTAKEYLDVPQKTAKDARTQLDALKAKGAPQADIDKASQKAAVADREAASWKKSYDLMRNDTFHTDKAVDDAVSRMKAKGATPEQIDKFKAKAYRVSTPDQVARLEAQGPLAPD